MLISVQLARVPEFTSQVAAVERVRVTHDALVAELDDGRTISAPLNWFPRLAHGTRREREQWRLIGGGRGVHWDLLDEDISVEGLLAGRPSGESTQSFKRWLASRPTRPTGRRTRREIEARSPRKGRSRKGRGANVSAAGRLR